MGEGRSSNMKPIGPESITGLRLERLAEPRRTGLSLVSRAGMRGGLWLPRIAQC